MVFLLLCQFLCLHPWFVFCKSQVTATRSVNQRAVCGDFNFEYTLCHNRKAKKTNPKTKNLPKPTTLGH